MTKIPEQKAPALQVPFVQPSDESSSENSPGMPQMAAMPTSVNTMRDQMEALPPAHKIELEQAHKAPVDAADDHENKTDFIKGLHKKDLLPLGLFLPIGRRFMHFSV